MILKHAARPWMVGVALVIAGVLVAGCGSNTTSPSGSGATSGTVAVGLRAATSQESAALGSPATLDMGGTTGGPSQGVAVDSLALTIDKIRLYPAEHDSAESGGEFGEGHGDGDADSSSTPLEFAIPPERVEVTALGETLTVLLANLNLPEGRYTHASIHITDAEGTLPDGQTVQVHVARPDGFLMVQIPFTVSAGSVTPIVLVIDLSRSIHEVPPGSGNYVLRPVLWGEMGQGENHWRRPDGAGQDRSGGGMPH